MDLERMEAELLEMFKERHWAGRPRETPSVEP